MGKVLNLARHEISLRQRKINSDAKQEFVILAFLFVLAVSVFEIFTKFFHESVLLLGFYLGIVAYIGTSALYKRWMLWEAVAEDYRAVAEMLRVQRAWLSAGLIARVDREHLQGVDQDLAPIRDCAKTIIAWILLRHGWKNGDPMRDWAHVRGTALRPRELDGALTCPDDWIGSQIWYFVSKGEARERLVHGLDAASWCLFVASSLLAAVLWLWLASQKAWALSENLAHICPLSWEGSIGVDVCPFLWLLLATMAIEFRYLNHDIYRGFGAAFLTGVLGALAAVGVAFALIGFGPSILKHTGSHDPHTAVTYAVIASVVVLSAIAGALRYLMERLNFEAEALEYRDALGRFERGERRLACGSDPATGAPADEAIAQRLVYELGCLALAENEAWLKSRRERPLTPVVG